MGLETLLMTLFGTAAVTFSLMFLPALIELAHPKDAGPRLIGDDMSLETALPMFNLEDGYHPKTELSGFLTGILKLPNLE